MPADIPRKSLKDRVVRRVTSVNVTLGRDATRGALTVWQTAVRAYAADEMQSEPFPSATVAIVRDADDGIEVLMVQRNVDLSFHGGAWVFPGGRVDPIDRVRAGSDDLVEAARHCAVREANEEAGVVLDATALVPFARWVTPEGLPKRFMTWFFVGACRRSPVVIDGGEVVDHRWFSPEAALASHARGEIESAGADVRDVARPRAASHRERRNHHAR